MYMEYPLEVSMIELHLLLYKEFLNHEYSATGVKIRRENIPTEFLL